uniref:Uncharacterized protein n=1 Tax=Arundo donax TaxID=35708 RepID=A0A0A9EYP1_ARUDO
MCAGEPPPLRASRSPAPRSPWYVTWASLGPFQRGTAALSPTVKPWSISICQGPTHARGWRLVGFPQAAQRVQVKIKKDLQVLEVSRKFLLDELRRSSLASSVRSMDSHQSVVGILFDRMIVSLLQIHCR